MQGVTTTRQKQLDIMSSDALGIFCPSSPGSPLLSLDSFGTLRWWGKGSTMLGLLLLMVGSPVAWKPRRRDPLCLRGHPIWLRIVASYCKRKIPIRISQNHPNKKCFVAGKKVKHNTHKNTAISWEVFPIIHVLGCTYYSAQLSHPCSPWPM